MDQVKRNKCDEVEVSGAAEDVSIKYVGLEITE